MVSLARSLHHLTRPSHSRRGSAEGTSMRRDFFFGAGALLLAVAIVGLLVASNFPGSAEVVRGIFFVTITVFPAVVGVVFFLIGAAEWYVDRRASRLEHHN